MPRHTTSETPRQPRSERTKGRDQHQQTPEQLPEAPPAPVVSRRDERGVAYPRDLPNPLGGTYRGCF